MSLWVFPLVSAKRTCEIKHGAGGGPASCHGATKQFNTNACPLPRSTIVRASDTAVSQIVQTRGASMYATEWVQAEAAFKDTVTSGS